MKTYSSVFF